MADFVHHAPYPILGSRGDGEIQYLNPAAERWLIGLPENDLEGLLPADHGNRVRRCLAYGRSLPETEVNVRGRFLVWVYTPTPEMSLVYLSVREVTRRLESEQVTRRLAGIVERITDLVFFLTTDGCVTYLNEAARRGLQGSHDGSHDALDGSLTLERLFTPSACRTLRQQAMPVAAACGVWSSELSLAGRRRPAEIPVSLTLLAHRDGADRVESFSLIARDLSDDKRAEKQRHRHRAEMARLGRLITMSEMASGLAHELNQPLAAIANYARGCVRRIDAAPPVSQAVLRDGLERISRQAYRATEIIDRLRAHMRSGEAARVSIRANDLLEELACFCVAEARHFRTEIRLRLEPELPKIRVDRVQIEQVMLNLLRNAMEASAGGRSGAPVPITLSALPSGGELLIRVRDRGPGVIGGDVERIFQPFFTTKRQGIGLGLSISRSIVEAHGGRLWAEAIRGGGAVFSVALPVVEEERP